MPLDNLPGTYDMSRCSVEIILLEHGYQMELPDAKMAPQGNVVYS